MSARFDDDRTRIVEDLHRRYAGAIFHKCLKMLRDRGEAEDAVQETYLKAYAILDVDAARERTSLLPWLYRIASHVCLHLLRTRRRKGLVPIGEPMVGVQSTDHRRLQARRHLTHLFANLDERDKDIVVLTFVNGLTQAQAARSLHVSRRAVVKRITAMRRRFGRVVMGTPCHAAG